MLSYDQRILLLQNTNMFSKVSEHGLAKVAAKMEEVSYKSGDTVFSEGDAGDSLYLIVETLLARISGFWRIVLPDSDVLTMFSMTFCYMIIDRENRMITYSNAGHPYPFHYSKKKSHITELRTTNMPLGMASLFGQTEFYEQKLEWQDGDCLLLYSDGISEAEIAEGIPFGEEKLKNLLIDNYGQSASTIKNAILNSFESHISGTAQLDDVTLVVVRDKSKI